MGRGIRPFLSAGYGIGSKIVVEFGIQISAGFGIGHKIIAGNGIQISRGNGIRSEVNQNTPHAQSSPCYMGNRNSRIDFAKYKDIAPLTRNR